MNCSDSNINAVEAKAYYTYNKQNIYCTHTSIVFILFITLKLRKKDAIANEIEAISMAIGLNIVCPP